MINETTQETVTEISKSQNIRLIDVFVLAPIMVYAGTFKTLPLWVRISLIGMGVATAVYNGKNFLQNKANLQQKVK
ncbi:MAG: hypothetical protein PHT69_02100 [Bacteroidales bacterium]|nr:hypothetical protein [Bacteroidales bacterium]